MNAVQNAVFRTHKRPKKSHGIDCAVGLRCYLMPRSIHWTCLTHMQAPPTAHVPLAAVALTLDRKMKLVADVQGLGLQGTIDEKAWTY